MGTPAGWYTQPDGQQMYWDGEKYTASWADGVSVGLIASTDVEQQARGVTGHNEMKSGAVAGALQLLRMASEPTAKDQERAHRAFLRSPVGQATTAKEERQGFFEIQLEVGSSQRDITPFGGNNTNITRTKTQSHAGTLAAIEAVGWRLEHVGHVFVVASESSRDKLLTSGQQTAISGCTIGIYLFRNVD